MAEANAALPRGVTRLDVRLRGQSVVIHRVSTTQKRNPNLLGIPAAVDFQVQPAHVDESAWSARCYADGKETVTPLKYHSGVGEACVRYVLDCSNGRTDIVVEKKAGASSPSLAQVMDCIAPLMLRAGNPTMYHTSKYIALVHGGAAGDVQLPIKPFVGRMELPMTIRANVNVIVT